MKIIKNNMEYKLVYNCKNSVSDYNLVLFLMKNNTKENRFGFTSAKKIKLAVKRNRIRRRLKEIVRLNEYKLKEGYDIIFMARVNAADTEYNALEKSFNKLMQRKNLYKKGDLNSK